MTGKELQSLLDYIAYCEYGTNFANLDGGDTKSVMDMVLNMDLDLGTLAGDWLEDSWAKI
jgi:hypothetical protein